jgi:hypothetical protein
MPEPEKSLAEKCIIKKEIVSYFLKKNFEIARKV